MAPFDKKHEADQKKQEFAVGNSDHLTMLKAYKVTGFRIVERRGQSQYNLWLIEIVGLLFVAGLDYSVTLPSVQWYT